MDIDNLVKEVKEIAEDKGITGLSISTYKQEVREAIATINSCRRFVPTDDVLYPKKYESLIIPMCISALAKIGAEGQTSHSENGITRGYENGDKYPTSLLNKITPLVK